MFFATLASPKHHNFDFQGLIYLKVEITFFEYNQNIDFEGRIYLEVETLIFTKVNEISAPPPQGPKAPPWGAKELSCGPKELARGSEKHPKTPILSIYIHIYSNSRSTAKRPILVNLLINDLMNPLITSQ